MAASIVREANGFYADATYSDDYLNKSGVDGYLDQSFVFGVSQSAGSQLDIDGNRVLTPAAIFGGAVDLAGFTPGDTIDLQINGEDISITVPTPVTLSGLASAINEHKSTTNAVAETTNDGKLIFKSYHEVVVSSENLSNTSSITIGGVAFTVSAAQLAGRTSAQYLRDSINATASGITASVSSAGALVITNSEGAAGEPIVIGGNNVGLPEQTYFNDDDLSVGVPATESASTLRSLGLRGGFVMNDALAEDLLVFGVNNQGLAASVYLSGSYEASGDATNLAPDSREYKIRFESGNYSLVDIATNTEVAAGVFDTTTRSVQYGNWTVSLSGIPADLDEYTVQPTDEPLGDNRIAAALANLQGSRVMLASKQTVQQEYENLVNRVGALTVQAEIAKDAQQVVFDHAREGRDQISGVNLDEELADLLRYQQAYQANAQVIQVANRLFDSLLQRL
jgi:flagellar hook-associated protein FlgK